MMPDGAAAERWRQLRETLERLVELGPAERAAALAALDPGLAAEARTLLAAADSGEASAHLEAMVAGHAAALLASQEAGAAVDERPGDQLAGLTLGPWRLEHLLGRGGMAEV